MAGKREMLIKVLNSLILKIHIRRTIMQVNMELDDTLVKKLWI
jgi:hypothetical protein